MQDTSKYPHFIPDKPHGVDCFEGHSQELLSHTMCDYVRQIDAKPDEGDEKTMPRIIGLEGSWGSGKSNVVNMVENELSKEGYYTFTYDAWGHQEDLQRRSILETMATRLIADKVLDGEVTIQLRNGKKHKDTWTNQLSLLLSNKTTTIRKTTPKLTPAAFWGIGIVALFAICSLVAGQLIDDSSDFCCYWWIDCIPLIVAAIVAAVYRKKDGNFDNIFRMVDHTNNDTIDEEYTSSEEPSVAEFKHWMKAISDHLNTDGTKYKRLIIVFDNMDRLPSDKVLHLWSSIYTFFAGTDFEHVWTIIPYDYKHLCQAIYGSESSEEEENKERIKQFISKTFPITYHVPQPVITDYQKLFNTYFEEAFGTDVHDREHICQVFMCLEDNPNPRTVIRFVNELVAMRLQWKDETKYRLQNLALYVLKRHELLYNGQSLEFNLLGNLIFNKVESLYPNKDAVRSEICQYAYGLTEEKLASELPLLNELNRCIKEGLSINNYAEQPNFVPILEKVLNGISSDTLNNAVKSMASLDEMKFAAEDERRIKLKWDFLANKKAQSKFDKHEYDETITTLIAHASQKRTTVMAKNFAKAMQQVKVTDGALYFYAQQQLQLALQAAKVPFDESNWYGKVECEPVQFVKYVCTAKEDYKHYGLTADIEELNNYLLNGAKDGDEDVAVVIDYIKDDKDFDLSDLREDLATLISEDEIKENIHTAAYVHRQLVQEEGVLKVRFKKETVAAYMGGDRAPWSEALPKGIEDVIAMSLADGKDVSVADNAELLVPRLAECFERYMSYTDVLKNLGKENSAFRLLNIYCVEHQLGKSLETKYAAQHLPKIMNTLGLDTTVMMKHFNQWKVKWGEFNAENEYVQNVKSFCHQSLFAAYRDNPGHFSDSIIAFGVQAISLQNTGFMADQATRTIDPYWRDFVNTFLGTKYMKEAGEMLTNEASTILMWNYQFGEDNESILLDKILEYADATTMQRFLHTMLNDHFVKTNISKQKFVRFGALLPRLGADMDANTARNLMTHFIKPICKDAECAAIIVAHKDFYLGVMQIDTTIAAPIAKDMVDMEEYAAISENLKAMLPKEEENK